MVFIRAYHLLKNSKGQTAVEYLMLIAVITFLFSVVAKSKIIKEYFGEEGAFAKQYRSTLEYTYRHGKNGNKPYKKPNYNIYDHDTYKIDGSRSHFFGHKDPYPNSP